MVALDLQDAYFHIPILQAHRRYLQFTVDQEYFQFDVLLFWPQCPSFVHESDGSYCSLSPEVRSSSLPIPQRLAAEGRLSHRQSSPTSRWRTSCIR